MVLGYCIGVNKTIEVSEYLDADYFYKEEHQIIFATCLEMVDKKIAIDPLAIINHLRKIDKLESVGGSYYINQLYEDLTSHANLEYHCRIIQECWMKRELIRTSYQTFISASTNAGDIFELMDGFKADQERLFAVKGLDKQPTIKDIAFEFMTNINEARNHNGVIGLPTGYSDLDRVKGGLGGGQFIIIAGRPGQGKSALALHICKNVAKKGHPVLFLSLEMSAIELFGRLLCAEVGMQYNQLTSGNYSSHIEAQIAMKKRELESLPFHIQDPALLNINNLNAKVKKAIQDYGIELVVIDYIQLMQGTNKKNQIREQEVAEISRGIKLLAKETNIPIIGLSQLSREVEKNPKKRPSLANLRESGSLEQDADSAILLYRPEIYDYFEFADGTSTKGMAEVIIAKNRNGKIGSILLRFESETMSFYDTDNKNYHPEDNDVVF